MNTRTPPFPIASWARAAALASMAVLSAQAATPAQDIETSFRQDRAACMSETSMHERGSCLREAAAVRSEARRGMRAASATPETHRHNALDIGVVHCGLLVGIGQVMGHGLQRFASVVAILWIGEVRSSPGLVQKNPGQGIGIFISGNVARHAT